MLDQFAQLPASAKYPSMLESAVSTSQTHFILSPVKIAELLTEIIKPDSFIYFTMKEEN